MIRLQTFGYVLSQPKKYKTDDLIIMLLLFYKLFYYFNLSKMNYDLTINLLCIDYGEKEDFFVEAIHLRGRTLPLHVLNVLKVKQ